MEIFLTKTNSKKEAELFIEFKRNPEEMKKRLDILRLLSQKKWYRSHLVKHLGLTSATMTYHLNKLVNLGIITVEINEENKNTQYVINEDRLRHLVDRAVEDILQK